MKRTIRLIFLSLVFVIAAKGSEYTDSLPLYKGIGVYNPGYFGVPQEAVVSFNLPPWTLVNGSYAFRYPILAEKGLSSYKANTPYVGDSKFLMYGSVWTVTSGPTTDFIPITSQMFSGPWAHGIWSYVTGIYTSPQKYPNTAYMWIYTNQTSWGNPNPNPGWNGYYYIFYYGSDGARQTYTDASHPTGLFYQPNFDRYNGSTYPSFPAALQSPNYGGPPVQDPGGPGDNHDTP